jgi:hypothetical protein
VRAKKSRAKLSIAVFLAVFALVMITVFAYGRTLSPLSIPYVKGYEGTYLSFQGVKMTYDGRRIVWESGSPPPPQLSPSVWDWAPDHFEIDPDDAVSGWQNLVGRGDFQGTIERNMLGLPEGATVSWEKKVVEGGKSYLKKYEAKIYYFDHTVYLFTYSQEQQFLNIGWMEKCNPFRNTDLALRIAVEKWENIEPQGNYVNFAAILGVEVLDVNYYRTDARGSKLEEGIPTGAVVRAPVSKGQMLTMYYDWNSFAEGVSLSPSYGEVFLQNLYSAQPEYVSPDPRLTDKVTVSIYLSEFGEKADCTPIVGVFSTSNPPMMEVKLRVHVLKVGSWIAPLTDGGTEKPPVNAIVSAWQDLADWFSKTFGVPLSIAGWVLLGIIFFFIFMTGMILLSALATHLGVRRGGGEEGE